MVKTLVVEDDSCTGCNACILTCSFTHEGYYSFRKSRIYIHKNEEKADNHPKVCIQCEEAPCLDICPTDALSRNGDTGAIQLDSESCTGCKLCVSACPYGGVLFDEEDEQPLICDLCGGEPECVKTCKLPNAITYG